MLTVRLVETYATDPNDPNPNVAPLGSSGTGTFTTQNNFRFGYEDDAATAMTCAYNVYVYDGDPVGHVGASGGHWWRVASGNCVSDAMTEVALGVLAAAAGTSNIVKVALVRSAGGSLGAGQALRLYYAEML